ALQFGAIVQLVRTLACHARGRFAENRRFLECETKQWQTRAAFDSLMVADPRPSSKSGRDISSQVNYASKA
ncbi:MAG: hypothetical protein KDD70_00395, partial [Bdellovibrionales bacterium]|nr:hypothetical protein [Bdellovibrionales bacterium]